MEIEEIKDDNTFPLVNNQEEDDDNSFEGELEEYKEKIYYGDTNYQIDNSLVIPSIKNNRELYNIVLVRKRKEKYSTS